MINKETILSNYNDRLTLLQWLKKVELALQNASAKEFRVNKLGNATLTFSIVFDDDTELTTGPIVLQQGESVASATISGGHLLLTLTNGDVLDAGDVGAVTGFSIDGSQHLIVTYQDGTTQDLGAIFQGNVNIAGNLTADSIIENMNGYSFTIGNNPNYDYEKVYVGAVKNGNKLTLVLALNFTKHPGGAYNPTLGLITVPSAVSAKLYPTTVGVYDFLDNRVLNIFPNQSSFVSAPCYISKETNNLRFVMENSANMTEEIKYYVRYEVTFLLSDSL